jgi:hypothetical protein
MTSAAILISSLTVATAVLSGCNSHSSLVYAGMPDWEIERRVRGELDGITNRDEQFRVVAGMTDWENFYAASSIFRWHGMPLVPWDSTRQEMLIPLASIRAGLFLSFPRVDGMIAIGFNGDGRVESVERRDVDREDWPFTFSDEWEVKLIEDPWLQASPQHNTQGYGATVWYGVPDTVHVDADDWRNSRWVDLRIWVAGVDAENLLPVPRVTASDSTEIVHIRAEGPEMTRPRVAGAFIVPSYWNEPHISHIPERYRVKFFPSVMATYRMLLVLEPHEGVDLTVEVLAEEAPE